jgi:DNA-directed RNA polymerase specialized sigma subunit
MENDLFDLVQLAQNGNLQALESIIQAFFPAIRSQRMNVTTGRQDDLEQVIIETVIKKILSYDLSKSPDFTSFCRERVMDSNNHE